MELLQNITHTIFISTSETIDINLQERPIICRRATWIRHNKLQYNLYMKTEWTSLSYYTLKH